jgi:AraC-like DNA-binding protein
LWVTAPNTPITLNFGSAMPLSKMGKMSIENIPEIYIKDYENNPDLYVYDFKMSNYVVRSKVNLSMNMFSFLQVGKKQVHFADASVAVNSKQSLLLKKGHWLWTELLDTEALYYCKLLFFSEKKLVEFLNKNDWEFRSVKPEISYFIIENDPYITSYLKSLDTLSTTPSIFKDNLLSIKFEELMLYLINKYGVKFKSYLHSLISKKQSHFREVVESNVYSNLKLDELAFLCNMSLSTFKRYFTAEFNVSPGKWLQDKRLKRAKDLLEYGNLKSSDIYLELGYNNLSNFSSAFKKKFGISPNEV